MYQDTRQSGKAFFTTRKMIVILAPRGQPSPFVGSGCGENINIRFINPGLKIEKIVPLKILVLIRSE